MATDGGNLSRFNVLASRANWAWPVAVHDVFEPAGVTLMVAEDINEFVNIIEQKRIHTTIVDIDSKKAGGLTIIKIIHKDWPLLPCLILTSESDDEVLSKALQLDVFSVINKPVDMDVLKEQLNRLFIKKYNSNIFS